MMKSYRCSSRPFFIYNTIYLHIFICQRRVSWRTQKANHKFRRGIFISCFYLFNCKLITSISCFSSFLNGPTTFYMGILISAIYANITCQRTAHLMQYTPTNVLILLFLVTFSSLWPFAYSHHHAIANPLHDLTEDCMTCYNGRGAHII